jgi:hypothetical protein
MHPEWDLSADLVAYRVSHPIYQVVQKMVRLSGHYFSHRGFH